jgi:hypothetical protein
MAGAVLGSLSTAAMANPPQPLPVPSPTTCNLSDVTAAIACVGYYTDTNIFSSSSADEGTQSTGLTALGFVGTPDYATIYANNSGYKDDALNGATSISFSASPTLSGITYVGIHWGNQSAIYELNLVNPVTSLTIIGQNPGGSSNAVLYSTGGAVPEPAAWAMMVTGLGAVGFAMRRRRTSVSFA